MKNLRSILPPMDTLATFEAAARLQSFTRAAGELHLTQAAVSRQIRLLEENLGTPLFHRAHRAVSLTPMGKSFQSTVALALAHIANAAVEHRGTTPKTHLNLGADQSIAWLWLMPRLAGFREAYPEINVRLVASDNKSDCLASEIDIAIAFGPDDWPGFLSEELFGEEIFPVCSPIYLQAQKIESSEDLLRCTLLELEDDTWGWVNWRMWLTSQGIHSPVETRSIQINNYPMVLQSARNGMGIALGWRHLVDDMIQAKELVVPVPCHMHTDNGYYLLIREAVPASPGAQAFRQWALEKQATHGGSKPDR